MVAFGAGEEDTRAAPRRPDNTQPLRTSIILESWHVLQHVESQGLDEEADRRVIVPHDERHCELNAALASPDPLRVLLRCPSVTIWFIRAAMSGMWSGGSGPSAAQHKWQQMPQSRLYGNRKTRAGLDEGCR